MIDILLPTYNGAKYLDKQIASLLSQTITDWRLLVRDDGSTDNTVSLIQNYVMQYPDQVVLIKDSYGNLRTSGCLNNLLPFIKGEYFMYCDQDDIWEPNKIERSLQEMHKLEEKFPNSPLLVCSDACCIDGNDNVIHESFFASQKFIEVTDDYTKMAALNVVQGSTSLMNRKVLEYMKFIPSEILHDGWTAVITAYYGHVKYIHEPLLRYRQHSANVLGAHSVGFHYFVSKLKNIKKQAVLYNCFFNNLPFRITKFRWLYYKIKFNIHRLK